MPSVRNKKISTLTNISFADFEPLFLKHLYTWVSVIVSVVSVVSLVSLCFRLLDVKEEVVNKLKLYTCTVIAQQKRRQWFIHLKTFVKLWPCNWDVKVWWVTVFQINESLYLHFLLKHIRHFSHFKSVTFNILTLSRSIQMLKVTLGLALVTLVACSQCPNDEVCEAGQTCCQDPTGEFSCCPFHHVSN